MTPRVQPEQIYRAVRMFGILLLVTAAVNIVQVVSAITTAGGIAPYVQLGTVALVLLFAPILLAMLQIWAGIASLVFHKRSEKASLLIGLVIAVMAFSLVYNIASYSFTGGNPLMALFGLLVPGIYLVCVIQLKSLGNP